MRNHPSRARPRTLPLASLILLAVLSLVLGGCTEDDIDGLAPDSRDETPEAGRYGAIGNSLTAGFINGGLIRGGQMASYPVLLAEQAGWSSPSMPVVAEPGIGQPNAQGIPQSALFVSAEGQLTSVSLDPGEIPDMLVNRLLPWPYDNLAIPGADLQDVLTATGATTAKGNLFFDFILRNSALPPGDWTVPDAMTARNPRYLTVWIGSNDVLGGALGGNPTLGGNVTEPSVFEMRFLDVIERVEAMSASVVAFANIPRVTSIPYVTTVPLGAEIPNVGMIPWRMEENLDGDDDTVVFVLLPIGPALLDPANALTYLDPPFGTGENTIPSHLTLTQAEVEILASAVDAYNEVIVREVNARDWAYVDTRSALEVLPSDPTNPGNLVQPNAIFPLLANPATGMPFQNALSAFSLDGVHPSELGQALVTNAFIASLNAAYDLEIELVDPASIANEVGWEQFGGKFDHRQMPGGGQPRPDFDAQGCEALQDLIGAHAAR